MPRSRGISRAGDGSYHVRLGRHERQLLGALPAQLRETIDAGDPSVVRLFPPAYDEPVADEQYRALVGDSLVDGTLEALRVFEETVDHGTLTEAELGSWLGAIESLRLVLGTQLAVTEDTYARELDPNDPDTPRLALYGWLSWLQEEAVEALSDGLPGN